MSIGEHVRHYQARKRAKTARTQQQAETNAKRWIREAESFPYFCAQQRHRIKNRFKVQELHRCGLTTRREPVERHERTRPSDFEITIRGNCQGAF